MNKADVTIEITADMNEYIIADTVVEEIHDFLYDIPPFGKRQGQGTSGMFGLGSIISRIHMKKNECCIRNVWIGFNNFTYSYEKE